MKESIIAFVIGTVASQKIPIRAPNKIAIIGEGGVKRTAEEFQKEFLGEIPINSEVGKQGDLGSPIVESKPDHDISKIYLEFATKIKSNYL